MKEPRIKFPRMKELTKSLINNINPEAIIYAEFASGGAMGYAGGFTLYLIEGETLFCYETSLFTNEDIYSQAVELLIKHQDQIKNNDIVVQNILFDHYYGGMGNNVFINKNILLEIGDEDFYLKRDNVSYRISTSVQGVFNNVVHEMKNSKNN